MTPNYSRFTGMPPMVTTFDGRSMVFRSHVEFIRDDGTRVRNRMGADSDGFSTPAAIWPIIPPFGDDAPASWFHDWGYRDMLEQLMPDGLWKPIALLQPQADHLILECMVALGTEADRRNTIYQSLVRFGKAAKLEDLISGAIPHGLTKDQLQMMQAALRG